ncbi:MAG: mechanosensitive ion channel family protein [Neisseriaceae bacterium]
MIESFLDNFTHQYISNFTLVKFVSGLIVTASIIIFAVLGYYLVKFVINCWIKPRLESSQSEYLRDLALSIKSGLFGHLVSAIILRIGSNFVIRNDDLYSSYLALVINKLSMFYLFMTIIFIITSGIKAINPYYEHKFEKAPHYPIKPYLNIIIYIVWIFSAIFIIAFFANSSLTKVVAGLGAASAVFLLGFRDTLLGIVASVQAAASGIVRIGDRIAIDKYNLDGIVLSISINNVKIKSLDNIISTFPTYMLTAEVVKNFRAYKEYGYRRIKTAIFIDVNSVKQLKPNETAKYDVSHLVNEYAVNKMENKVVTNLELFRLYVEDYLKKCPYIIQDDDLAVYLISPTATGQPVEIYAFTTLADWDEYEHLQSQILEYCLVKLSEFDLVAFQYKN